jgi:S1-C subfamily serine protease
METRLGGVGGLSLQAVGRLERLELGPYALERPIAVLSKPGPGSTSSPGSIGNIGGDVLQRFRVTFDYPRKELHIVAGQAYARPFEADMTGMILTIKPDGDAPVEVVKVNPGSPAADAGIAAGDRVASIDGRPLAAGDLAGLRKRMKTEGEELHLGLVRGTERPAAVIVTRRMI